MVRRPLNLLVATALVLATGFLAPGRPHATTVRAMSLTDLVTASDSVVRARALGNRVRTDPDTLLHYTITRFQVLEDVKGPLHAGDHFEVEVMGGEAPGSGWATIVAEAPRFADEEEVVLFTRPAAGSMRQIAGFFQGAIRVRRGPTGADEVVSPPVAFPDAATPAQVVPRRQSRVRAAGRAPATASGPPAATTAARAAPRGQSGSDAGRPARAAGGRMKTVDFLDVVRDLHAADVDASRGAR